ncbi:MAG: hypothetical protein NZM26_04995 [Patescibacteria group bacterium]|nr:hypothetical protein [Patescibacteria group bacterium]
MAGVELEIVKKISETMPGYKFLPFYIKEVLAYLKECMDKNLKYHNTPYVINFGYGEVMVVNPDMLNAILDEIISRGISWEDLLG